MLYVPVFSFEFLLSFLAQMYVTTQCRSMLLFVNSFLYLIVKKYSEKHRINTDKFLRNHCLCPQWRHVIMTEKSNWKFFYLKYIYFASQVQGSMYVFVGIYVWGTIQNNLIFFKNFCLFIKDGFFFKESKQSQLCQLHKTSNI